MGLLQEANVSLWAATTADEEAAPAGAGLAADMGRTFDVAVVGAGITGLSAALAAAEAGASTVVIEAGRLCSGVTAYTTAKVTSLHGLKYAGLVKAHGEDAARLYGDANEAAIAQVADWVGRHRIDCDFSRRPAFTYTTSGPSVSRIADEVEAAQKLGLPATFTAETDLPFDVAGAVRFDEQAQFHPRRYCLGLARALAGLGGRVHEGVRATGVEEGSPCTVHTTGGAVRAAHVVLATHLPFHDKGGFFAKCEPMRSYALAARLDGPVPTGMYLSADSPTRSVRAAMGDTVVVLGGEGHKVGQDDDTRQRYAALEAWARATFPVAAVEHRWSAQDHTPADGLPFVGRQAKGSRVFVATGFDKWGMTNGTAAGIMIADDVTGRGNRWAGVFDASRQRDPLTSRDLYRANVNVARQFVGDRLGSLRPPPAESLEPGSGGIVSLDGDKVAAFRDDDGTLHALSPVCTHMGCLVSFNTAERSWDCPCHGSRFTVDGGVIEGPAKADLARKEPG